MTNLYQLPYPVPLSHAFVPPLPAAPMRGGRSQQDPTQPLTICVLSARTDWNGPEVAARVQCAPITLPDLSDQPIRGDIIP